MNVVQSTGWLPAADHFVSELVRRVDAGYAKAIVPIAKAIVIAGGDPNQMLQFSGRPVTKAAFLLGCCAEELASLGDRLSGRQGNDFVRAVVEQLRRHARPLKAKRISPDLRRLLADFRTKPSRTRLQTVFYMLEVNGMAALTEKLAGNAVAELAVEFTVMTDGISGVLPDLMEARRPIHPE